MHDPRLASGAALAALCAAFSLASPVLAQRLIAYPQDTLTHSDGTAVPFGADPGLPGFDEGRWQQMIPATHLPTTPAAITGLEVVSQTLTGPILYQSLVITLSNTPSEATSTQFAANLPNPVTVFQRQGHVILWQAGQWGSIAFDAPFQHDGRSNLFVDIRKAVANLSGNVAARMALTSDPGRRDLPPHIFAAGRLGSGAANATMATASAAGPRSCACWCRGRSRRCR